MNLELIEKHLRKRIIKSIEIGQKSVFLYFIDNSYLEVSALENYYGCCDGMFIEFNTNNEFSDKENFFNISLDKISGNEEKAIAEIEKEKDLNNLGVLK